MSTTNNTLGTNAVISYNKEHDGIELSFKGKPSEAVRTQLKSDRFRWSRYNGVWYKKDSHQTREQAAKYGIIPADLKLLSDNNDAAFVAAQEEAYCDSRYSG